MLAFIAIFFGISLIASILVIAATMLSSRLSLTEEHYLAEEYEVEHGRTHERAADTSTSSW